MNRTEQRRIADACTAVIAAAIEDVVAEFPDADPEAQARRAVRALTAQGWHITPEPLCARLPSDHACEQTAPPEITPAAALRSA
ncbi:hypothetical protein DMA15_12545 [Streptomyces sp. WAC 01529]|uniref:hypothetical protein n=1 Tax=Streptomyces sp. WAC 01529 TaxID=2203205 RepID=UPI000F6C3A45|nr:hypothetical protein [Streptomyces sp. WAC 01529]AZM53314.1 hypothetical protein DMA15_12545 [Streptomyces sp. WAC 01529]